jgi:hypothetical protein
MDGAPSCFVASMIGTGCAPPAARDAPAFNHEISAAGTIPCGTVGAVRPLRQRQHSQLRATHLHKLGIKVKIGRVGAIGVIA